MKKNIKGFTLAEVLITLSILGIIAAISIPNIIQQYQKRLTITKLQQAYSILENVAQNIAINTGCVGRDLACTGLLEYSGDAYKYNRRPLSEKIIELSGLKIKNRSYNIMRYNALNINSINPTYGVRTSYGRVTNINNIGFDFSIQEIHTSTDYNEKEKGISVVVFTSNNHSSNSDNKIVDGKNVFGFVIYDNFIVEPSVKTFGGATTPVSKLNDSVSKMSKSYIEQGCNPSSTTNLYGNSCAAKIIQDGWKITYY